MGDLGWFLFFLALSVFFGRLAYGMAMNQANNWAVMFGFTAVVTLSVGGSFFGEEVGGFLFMMALSVFLLLVAYRWAMNRDAD